MKEYDHKKIEKKWQKEWVEKNTYRTLSAKQASAKKMRPFYILDMFPYPSGVGLHVGHPRGYIGSDVLARKMRMQGYNVLHPMGYDAFGLPAEQYALEHKIHPRKAVEKNVATFEKQLSIIGLSYDWARKINTTDPEYYKWTQWGFLQIYNSWFDPKKNKARPIAELVRIFETKGSDTFSAKEWKAMTSMEKQNVLMQYRLAYEGYSDVNWCPHLGTVLANDEIVESPTGPISERGGYPVEKKRMRQWFMRITAYGDRLIEDLEKLNWPAHMKEIQKNWIGKSEGSEIAFELEHFPDRVSVFTTRADTLFGVTYLVLAPEHLLVEKLKSHAQNESEIDAYIVATKKKDEMMRTATDKDKTGVELVGVRAMHPATKEPLPVWIADYVLPQYGTGAVMAVPAHDERDAGFALRYELPVKNVVTPFFAYTTGPDAVRNDKPMVKRDTVVAIVKHWSEDKYIGLKWKNQNWKTFVVGGTNGENPEIAAVREVQEETGYKNIKYVRTLGEAQSQFYATHKSENRWAFMTGVYLELENGDHIDVVEGEKQLHEVVWLSKKEVESFVDSNESFLFWNAVKDQTQIFTNDGVLVNSEMFDGLTSQEAREKITEAVGGKIVTKYKFRDAVFARQRYWGEPIPLAKNADGVISEVSLSKLPLELPKVTSYEPTGTGEGPLASVSAWKKAGYETNTMPGWAGSSWYFMRYIDPSAKKQFASDTELAYWFNKKKTGGVDVYVGGAEHATGHLLYARFWHKVFFDLGYVPTKEPFEKLMNQGMILAADGRKMSKRWGNVVNPDEIVSLYGADTLRLYEMFMGPFDASLPWSTESIIGSRRFIERVWKLQARVVKKGADVSIYETVLHKTIKKVTEDIESFSFNTAVSAMMICSNTFEKAGQINEEDFLSFVKILAPFTPHLADELWNAFAQKGSIHSAPWPTFNPKKLVSETMTIAVSVNGKVKAELVVSKDATESEIVALAQKEEKLILALAGRNPQRVIYVPNRLVNFVI